MIVERARQRQPRRTLASPDGAAKSDAARDGGGGAADADQSKPFAKITSPT
jgi:hypothetical protein